jgi:choline dehydrogenase-like flavoprotein
VYDATATRILCDDGPSINGIELRSLSGAPRTARARIYVVACGGIETARLLLLSRSARFPDGLGNHSDLVGRCFMEHPATAVGVGTVEGLWNPWSNFEAAYSEPSPRQAEHDGVGRVRLRWRALPSTIDFDPAAPLETARRGMRAVRELTVQLKTEMEMEPLPANRVTLAARRDVFGNPGASLQVQFTDNDRRTVQRAVALVRSTLADIGAANISAEAVPPVWLHHHLGTCRMGDNPATSVVDRDLRVHDVDNLYVAGSAPFVTAGVANPTLTIVALSLRLADHISERLVGQRA